MLAQQVAKKYGNALFEIAREKGLIEQAWEQFNSLADYLRKDSTFLNFMSAPQIPDADKLALVEKTFKPRLDRPFYNFLLVLVDKRRIIYLVEIVEEFDRLVRQHKGIARAVCITTVPINDEERRRLIEKLSRKTNLKIELEEKIDRSIVGGTVVILQNQIMDGSIRYALSLLRNRLMKVKVH